MVMTVEKIIDIINANIEKIRIKRIKQTTIKKRVCVMGCPRSGTTWLLEILSELPNYSMLFEPLNPDWFPELRKIKIEPRPYKNSSKNWIEGKEYFNKVFNGNIQTTNPYIRLRVSTIFKRILANKLIVKFVRGNRLLPWLLSNYESQYYLLLIRHPCSVINSQMKTNIFGYNYINKDMTPAKENILKEIKKIELIPEYIVKRTKSIKTLEELLTIIWYIDYYIPLRICQKKIHTISYEDMYNNIECIKGIFYYIKEEIPIKIENIISRPSITTYKYGKKELKLGVQLSKWKKQLSKQKINNIINLLHDLGVDYYNNNETINIKQFINWKKQIKND